MMSDLVGLEIDRASFTLQYYCTIGRDYANLWAPEDPQMQRRVVWRRHVWNEVNNNVISRVQHRDSVQYSPYCQIFQPSVLRHQFRPSYDHGALTSECYDCSTFFMIILELELYLLQRHRPFNEEVHCQSLSGTRSLRRRPRV
jgi:hypothetical protein